VLISEGKFNSEKEILSNPNLYQLQQQSCSSKVRVLTVMTGLRRQT